MSSQQVGAGRRAVVFSFVFCLTTTGCAGESRRPREQPLKSATVNQTGVQPSQIEKLRLGMTIAEAADALAPTLPLGASVPALDFPVEGGGHLYLVFYREDSEPEVAAREDSLQYVVLFPSSKMASGRYVLPRERQGQPFRAPRERDD